MQSIRILVIAASIGAGHKRAAAAVGAAFRSLHPGCRVEILDILDFFPKWMTKLFLSVYFRSLILCPWVYARAYAWGNAGKTALYGRSLLSRFLARRLRRFILEQPPAAVVCTHAAAAAAVDELLSREKLALYHAAVVTDFVVHRFWLNRTIADYFIAAECIASAPLLRLVPPEQFQALGIPVAAEFGYGHSAECGARPDGQKTILIMGGGEGLLPMRRLLQVLNASETPLKLVFLAGRNEKLRRILIKAACRSRHSVTVLGFVDSVPALMSGADAFISKAGGLSASEALCAGLPILFYRPLPGQERANADFLVQQGVAIEIANWRDFPTEIDKIFGIDHNIIKNMKTAAKLAAKPQAAENIAKYILNKVGN